MRLRSSLWVPLLLMACATNAQADYVRLGVIKQAQPSPSNLIIGGQPPEFIYYDMWLGGACAWCGFMLPFRSTGSWQMPALQPDFVRLLTDGHDATLSTTAYWNSLLDMSSPGLESYRLPGADLTTWKIVDVFLEIQKPPRITRINIEGSWFSRPTFRFTFWGEGQPAAIPEPTTVSLLAVAGGMWLWWHRQRSLNRSR